MMQTPIKHWQQGGCATWPLLHATRALPPCHFKAHSPARAMASEAAVCGAGWGAQKTARLEWPPLKVEAAYCQGLRQACKRRTEPHHDMSLCMRMDIGLHEQPTWLEQMAWARPCRDPGPAKLLQHGCTRATFK